MRTRQVLFDQGTPVSLRRYLSSHSVSTVFEKGWNTLQNGDLPRTAEREGVEDLGNDGPESKRSTEPEGAADCYCRARDNELTYDREKGEPSRRRYRFSKAGRLLR